MRKAPRALALLAVAAISLTGCFHVEMNFDLQEDDTADVELIIAASQEVLDEWGDETVRDRLESEEAIEGVVTEPYESDEVDGSGQPAYVGTRTTHAGKPLSDIQELSIIREGDDYVVFSPPVDLSEESDGEKVSPDATITMSVTFPGEVIDHNGVREGNTVTWDVTSHTEALEARGSATADDGLPSWIIFVAIALAGVGIGLAIVLFSSSRRRDDRDPQSVISSPDDDFQGTVDMADAGVGTVPAETEPVVETEQVVDTTSDEDPYRP